MRASPQPLRRLLVLAGVVALLATGCASDDGAQDEPAEAASETAVDETEAADAPTASEEPSEDAAATETAFCDAFSAAGAALAAGPDVDFEAATPEEIQEALASFGEQLEPLLTDLEGSAPEEIAGDAATLAEEARKGLETGDDPAGVPAYQEADAAVDAFAIDACDYQTADVTAVDYAYEGLPATLEAGPTAFAFSNEGEEVHEMILFRLNDDTEESVEELLQLPEEESQSKIAFTGAAFGPPGAEDTAFVDLEAGRYAVVCFIPTGATSMEVLEAAGPPPGEESDEAAPGEGASEEGGPSEDASEADGAPGAELGPPHFTQGMLAEFEVS